MSGPCSNRRQRGSACLARHLAPAFVTHSADPRHSNGDFSLSFSYKNEFELAGAIQGDPRRLKAMDGCERIDWDDLIGREEVGEAGRPISDWLRVMALKWTATALPLSRLWRRRRSESIISQWPP